MNDVHSVAEVKLKNKLNVFYIVTSKRTYYVQATSKKELDEWVEAINKVKKVQEEQLLHEDTGSQADSEDMSEKTPSMMRISTQLPTQKVKSPLSGSTSPVLNNSLTSPEKATAAIDIPPRNQLQTSDYNAEGGHSFASVSSYTSAGSIPNVSSSPSSPVAGQYAKDSSDPTASSEDEDVYEDMVDELDDGRIIHKGFVYKLDRYKKIWKKRWFVLKNDRLFYYKNPKPHQNINLADILDVIEADPISKSKQNCFKVITPKRTYICCVSSEESQVAWLAALQVALSKKKEKQKETESS
ncbi:11034_t:CDS:2 [Funneliformis caledonium]|uniref:11034_t:CDS:1 n=1 Tax=Funneliformis caledonium TaxID=1117310 RepID=A0A9N9EF37_9GLOM|nr:11034_t:CDS:2 [Funneliformis caledonium]